jgi:uncharacterized protein
MLVNSSDSPCIKVCRLDDHKICQGCWRSLAEIAQWTQLTPADRAVVLERVVQRQARHHAQKVNAAQ